MSNKGFTLAEVLFVSVILVVLLVAIISASVQMRAAFTATDIYAELQGDARLAINAMTTDLRKTSYSQVSITQDYPVGGSDRMQYRLPTDSDSDGQPDLSGGGIVWGNLITVEIESSAEGKKLVKTEGSDKQILAENVKKVNFIDYNIDSTLYLDEIQIILELEGTDGTGKTYSRSFTSIVNMRN